MAWYVSSERFFKEREIPSGIRVAIGKEYLKNKRLNETSGIKLELEGRTCKEQPNRIEIVSIEAKNKKERRIYSGEVQISKHDYEELQEKHQITIGGILIYKSGKIKRLNRYKPHIQETTDTEGVVRILYNARIKEKYIQRRNIEKILPTLVIEGCSWIS